MVRYKALIVVTLLALMGVLSARRPRGYPSLCGFNIPNFIYVSDFTYTRNLLFSSVLTSEDWQAFEFGRGEPFWGYPMAYFTISMCNPSAFATNTGVKASVTYNSWGQVTETVTSDNITYTHNYRSDGLIQSIVTTNRTDGVQLRNVKFEYEDETLVEMVIVRYFYDVRPIVSVTNLYYNDTWLLLPTYVNKTTFWGDGGKEWESTHYTYTTVAIFGLSTVSMTFNSKRSAPLNSFAIFEYDLDKHPGTVNNITIQGYGSSQLKFEYDGWRRVAQIKDETNTVLTSFSYVGNSTTSHLVKLVDNYWGSPYNDVTFSDYPSK